MLLNNLQNIILSGSQVSELLPQKPPIEMVDTLHYNDEQNTLSSFTILENNIFCKNGKFTEPGLIENIAQTAALRVGYIVSQMKDKGENVSPPIGYIGAVKNLRIFDLPNVNTQISTIVTIENVVFDVTIIKGKITQQDRTLAECEMKIFLKKD